MPEDAPSTEKLKTAAATRKARVAVAVGARDGDGGRVVAADADGGVCDRGDCGEHKRVS